MNNPFSLFGKTVLVTGAAGGIGSETAKILATLGAHVVLTDIREEPLNNTLGEVRAISPDGHLALVADLTKEDSLTELVSDCPNLDGLVCNAGVMKLTPVPFIN